MVASVSLGTMLLKGVRRVDGAEDRGGETARPESTTEAAVCSTLVVSPFIHHGRFRSFLTALEQRPGVLGVRAGRVRAGAVWLTVQHAGGVPILPLLQSLTEFGPRIEPDGGGRWLVHLTDVSDDEL